ncbi:hypothetical protein ACWCSD_34460 [Nonomuraea sp. NPDC001684]
MTTDPAPDADAEEEFLILDQAATQGTKPRRRPWATCLGCGHRIWATKSLQHRRGDKCRRGQRRQHGRGHGRPRRTWLYIAGQADLFTSKEPSMTTTAPAVDVTAIAAVFVADTLDESGLDVTVRHGHGDQPEVTLTLDGKPFRLHLTQLPAPDGN